MVIVQCETQLNPETILPKASSNGGRNTKGKISTAADVVKEANIRLGIKEVAYFRLESEQKGWSSPPSTSEDRG